MAIAGMAATDEDSIRAQLKRPEYKRRIDPAGAHDPDNAQVLRIFQARRSGKIRPCVGTPVAGYTQYLWFKFHKSSPSIPSILQFRLILAR
jgi:hypothetical protein